MKYIEHTHKHMYMYVHMHEYMYTPQSLAIV